MQQRATAEPLRVLVVEDSEDDAFLLLRELRKGGYDPTSKCVYSLTAIETAIRDVDWDLILSDYNLPGFSALDVLRLLHESGRDLPVIIVSGAIGEDLAVEAMHAGAHDYIMKDNLTRLVPAVRRELHEMEVHRQRQAAEAALSESEEHFRQLAGNIEGVLWLVDLRSQHMLYVNAAYEQIWERSCEPLFLSLDAFLDTVHPEDFARIESLLKTEGWAGFNAEYRIQQPDGSVRWINTHSFPICDDLGSPYRCAGLSYDITDRKLLELERRKLSRALEQSADAVMITDCDGVIEYVNPAYTTVTGYSAAESLGRKPNLLNSGLHETEFFARLWKSLLNGVPFSDIFINRRKDGDLYYEAKTITPVRDEQGDVTHFVATGKDITESLRRKRTEQRVTLYDDVTGLANKVLFKDRVSQLLSQSRRDRSLVAMLCVAFDLSGLFGDENSSALEERLLVQTAQRLQEVVRESDVLARIGDDEFAIAQRVSHTREAIEDAATRLLQAFSSPVKTDGYELFLAPRMGISLFPADADGIDTLLARARIAMQHARQEGGARYCFYHRDMKSAAKGHHSGHRLSS